MKMTMNRLVAGILMASFVGVGAALAHGEGSQGKSGPVAPQMGSGSMMSPGQMMGPGMMMGATGMPCHDQTAKTDMSADDVRSVIDGHLKRMGHARLKVGEVKKMEKAFVASVTTVDGSLVWKLEVDPHTGTMHHVDE